MRFIFSSIISAVAVAPVLGDGCQDFCLEKLGTAGCTQGSYCKTENNVCHGIYWVDRASGSICHFANGNCSDAQPVTCQDADVHETTTVAPRRTNRRNLLSNMLYCGNQVPGAHAGCHDAHHHHPNEHQCDDHSNSEHTHGCDHIH